MSFYLSRNRRFLHQKYFLVFMTLRDMLKSAMEHIYDIFSRETRNNTCNFCTMSNCAWRLTEKVALETPPFFTFREKCFSLEVSIKHTFPAFTERQSTDNSQISIVRHLLFITIPARSWFEPCKLQFFWSPKFSIHQFPIDTSKKLFPRMQINEKSAKIQNKTIFQTGLNSESQ